MEWITRPIAGDWPADAEPPRAGGYRSSPFSAGWGRVMELLDRELAFLDAKDLVLQMALAENQIRLDGKPRASASPEHPGIILSFRSEYGPLKYATSIFPRWSDNLYAIALGLEALRKVDRYGITKRGQQYAGWKALPAGSGPSTERGRELVEKYGGKREAQMATHPDRGGDSAEFADVHAYLESQR